MSVQTPPWDDLKVAFGCENPSRLWNAYESKTLSLPEGWSLCETDGAGARYVAVFRVEIMPTREDAFAIKAQLRRWAR